MRGSLLKAMHEHNLNLIKKGRISWLDYLKLDRQSILTSLIKVKNEVRGWVLDVGCGERLYESIFNNAEKYIGIDVVTSKKMDIRADVNYLPLKSEVFDTILCTQVLEHVCHPSNALKECYRCLKKNGTMIITVPFTAELHDVPQDYYRFTRFGIEYLAKNVGFKVIYIKETAGFWANMGQRINSKIWGKKSSLLTMICKSIICSLISFFFASLDTLVKDNESESSFPIGYVSILKKRGDND